MGLRAGLSRRVEAGCAIGSRPLRRRCRDTSWSVDAGRAKNRRMKLTTKRRDVVSGSYHCEEEIPGGRYALRRVDGAGDAQRRSAPSAEKAGRTSSFKARRDGLESGQKRRRVGGACYGGGGMFGELGGNNAGVGEELDGWKRKITLEDAPTREGATTPTQHSHSNGRPAQRGLARLSSACRKPTEIDAGSLLEDAGKLQASVDTPGRSRCEIWGVQDVERSEAGRQRRAVDLGESRTRRIGAPMMWPWRRRKRLAPPVTVRGPTGLRESRRRRHLRAFGCCVFVCGGVRRQAIEVEERDITFQSIVAALQKLHVYSSSRVPVERN